MDWEAFEKHKPFAGEKKPSMLRRRVGHDYESRRIYLITMTVEGRRPLLGRLVGDAEAAEGSPEAPRIELSPLGEEVRNCWTSISNYYPEVKVLAITIMPDHLHGILFVERQMEQHLGMVIKGFKAGCNKAYRRWLAAQEGLAGRSMPQQCCSKENHGDGSSKENSSMVSKTHRIVFFIRITPLTVCQDCLNTALRRFSSASSSKVPRMPAAINSPAPTVAIIKGMESGAP